MLDQSGSWAQLHKLSEQILRANSATDALERWCIENAIAAPPVIALCARNASTEPMDPDSSEAIYPYAANQVPRFRRVQLAAAGLVLADALNWYFPDNLSAAICHQLETTELPFGKAIKHLDPVRRTFLVRLCTPEQLISPDGTADPASTAFEHRAVVYSGDGKPLAVVHERFRTILVLPIPKFAAVSRNPSPSTGLKAMAPQVGLLSNSFRRGPRDFDVVAG